MEVWILESGEVSEGRRLRGVFASKDLARSDFEQIAERMIKDNARFNAKFNPHKKSPIDLAEQSDNGSLTLRAGCQIVFLYPTTVVTQRRISA
jgi:hypothetical protein